MSRKDETKGEDMESDIIKISHLNKSFGEVKAVNYPEDTCLAAMMTCNECKGVNPIEPIEDKGILEKIDRLVSEKISTIHVGVCRLPDGKHECPRMTQICNMIEERGIKVVRGSHKE